MNHLTIMYMRFWPDRHGGVEEHLWRFASRAASHVNVEVLTENRGDHPACESPMPNLTIHRFKNSTPFIWRWPYLARLRMWMKQLSAHPPKGWIWTIEPTATMAAILSGYGNRVIYNPPSCFGTMHKVWENQPHVDTMKIAGIVRWFDQLAFTRAAKVVVASRSLGKQYTLCYGVRDNVHVVPRGADRELISELPNRQISRKKLGLDANAFVIGFVGRLDPCKDIPHLINACACPSVLRPHDRVLIVGDGPDKMRIQGSIRANGLSDRVILTGSLHDEELRQAYSAMDVFVLPSVYEGYGMVILEAMAAGLPVIGRPGDWKTSFTSMPEMIQHQVTGLLMHEHNPEDLAEKLQWMSRRPERRIAMGKRARAALAERTWEAVVEDYLKLLPDDPGQNIQIAA